ncbi:hypothetical protein LSTR_LSTR014781 [Laodelphax striatellus]|uniref:Uncharacterized protein n=1 Tax=Laodelphax striatellus TaxID=195883 RepID=A0A482WI55_LAOST|nr:hypothetical protein LSTR_LSTR014781 [Laodelphax striatellus]
MNPCWGFEWKGVGCPPPGVSLNGSRVVPRPGAAPDYSTLSEVKFPAELQSPSVLGPDRRLCKIKCIGGRWVGPLCRPEQGETTKSITKLLKTTL